MPHVDTLEWRPMLLVPLRLRHHWSDVAAAARGLV
jgi:hypothetical protein